MGNEGSFCSAGHPGATDAHDAPGLALNCGGGCSGPNLRRIQEWGADEDTARPMQVGNLESLRDDRINAFSKDIKAASMCGMTGMTCGKATKAPTGYLADTLDGGMIVVDSKDGPIWMDDESQETFIPYSASEKLSKQMSGKKKKGGAVDMSGPGSNRQALVMTPPGKASWLTDASAQDADMSDWLAGKAAPAQAVALSNAGGQVDKSIVKPC